MGCWCEIFYRLDTILSPNHQYQGIKGEEEEETLFAK